MGEGAGEQGGESGAVTLILLEDGPRTGGRIGFPHGQTCRDWHSFQMDQLRDYADARLVQGCIYCGGPAETRDHVPSRVLLDSPLPENLPVVGACFTCNNGFSQDERYFACFTESVIAGSTDPDHIHRPNIANILRKDSNLRARLEAAREVKDGNTQFYPEPERIKNVLLKLARGHAAFELSQIRRDEPSSIWWRVLPLMTQAERDEYKADEVHVVGVFGEVGARATQRTMVVEASLASANGDQRKLQLVVNDWVDVQEDRYRYLAIDDSGGIVIRMIISEYFACEVRWNWPDQF